MHLHENVASSTSLVLNRRCEINSEQLRLRQRERERERERERDCFIWLDTMSWNRYSIKYSHFSCLYSAASQIILFLIITVPVLKMIDSRIIFSEWWYSHSYMEIKERKTVWRIDWRNIYIIYRHCDPVANGKYVQIWNGFRMMTERSCDCMGWRKEDMISIHMQT